MQHKQYTLMRLLFYGYLAKQFLVNVTDDLSSAIWRNIKPCPENCAVRMKWQRCNQKIGTVIHMKQ